MVAMPATKKRRAKQATRLGAEMGNALRGSARLVDSVCRINSIEADRELRHRDLGNLQV